MKTLFLITNEYNIGGGERNLIDIAVEFNKRNYKIIVLLPKVGDISHKLDELEIPYYIYSTGDIYHERKKLLQIYPLMVEWLSFFKIMLWIIRNHIKPDIVYSNNGMSLILSYMISVFTNSKLLWCCHGPWEAPRKLKAKLINFMVDKTIAITEEIYDIIDCKNKCIVPLGIVCEKNNYIAEKNSRIKKIACIARFQYIKGQDILVKSFLKLNTQMNNVELHFFGSFLSNNKKDREFYNYVRELVQEDDSIRSKVFFHGFCDNIREKMIEYDLVCVPSRYESYSIVTLEAMNNGMIVVAPDIGGPRFIIEDRKNGFLFKTGDSNDLSLILYNILSGKDFIKKKNILERVNEFKIERQVDRLIDIFNCLYKEVKLE